MQPLALTIQLREMYTQKYGNAKSSALVISGPTQDTESLFDDLCDVYWNASVEECKQVRETIAASDLLRAAFLGNAIVCGRNIKTSADEHWLRWGLASASIEDCSKDFRDVLLALAELFVRAERTGLEPNLAFQSMALRSNMERARGGQTSMSQMLSTFQHSAVLSERRRMKKRGYFGE